MPNGPKLIYWDACVFLSYIEGIADRLPDLEALLERSGPRRDHQLVTSELSRVEVAFAAEEKQRRVLSPAIEAAIERLWADRQVVKTVEVHQIISTDARRLMRRALTEGRSLKPADAIHLATAQWLQVAEMHTYDDRLFTYDAMIGRPIHPPRVEQRALILPTE